MLSSLGGKMTKLNKNWIAYNKKIAVIKKAFNEVEVFN